MDAYFGAAIAAAASNFAGQSFYQSRTETI
jgi:hypothetical protein